MKKEKIGFYAEEDTKKDLELIRKHDLREDMSDTIRYLIKKRVKEIKEGK